jgi:sigma-B regulation protein RsbU (phosphoserine phosphatase)
MGIDGDQRFEQATVKLEKSDLLLLYTDGITEAMEPAKGAASRELFGIERLDALLADCGATSADGCIARVRAAVAAFSGNATPTDDQTLIAIRCL